MESSVLSKKTLPLHSEHVALDAKLVSFGDWEVPVYYTSILAEHAQVRNSLGIFDISHMGELSVEGADAISFLQYVLTNNVNKITVGQTLYSPVCNAQGGILDDVIVYRFSDTLWMVVVNASNVGKIFTHFKNQSTRFKVSITNPSERRGIFAVQGPHARDLGRKVFGDSVARLPHHHFTTVTFEDLPVIYSSTGYTGEPGFEIFFDQSLSLSLWKTFFQAGHEFGLKSIGFGARDTLRLEGGCLLYGNDMDESVTPLEAGLAWTVDFSKPDFLGKSSLEAQKKNGLRRKLVAFEIVGRAVARHGYPVVNNGTTIGVVTSGVFAPTLQKSIGLAMINRTDLKVGDTFSVLIRDKAHEAKIVKLPFYKSPHLIDLRKAFQ
jgi:aminomethyltransferase